MYSSQHESIASWPALPEVFADVVLYFNQMTWIAATEPVAAFDLNGNGSTDFADIVALLNEI